MRLRADDDPTAPSRPPNQVSGILDQVTPGDGIAADKAGAVAQLDLLSVLDGSGDGGVLEAVVVPGGEVETDDVAVLRSAALAEGLGVGGPQGEDVAFFLEFAETEVLRGVADDDRDATEDADVLGDFEGERIGDW